MFRYQWKTLLRAQKLRIVMSYCKKGWAFFVLLGVLCVCLLNLLAFYFPFFQHTVG